MLLQGIQRSLSSRFRFVPAGGLVVSRKALGLLFGRFSAFAVLLGCSLQAVVLPGQCIPVDAGVLLRLLEFQFLVMHCVPGAKDNEQRMGLVILLGRIR